MNEQVYFNGRWPGRGSDYDLVLDLLEEKARHSLIWGKDVILGFPSSRPHRIGLDAFEMFQKLHQNAILTHTRGEGEHGFHAIGEIERDVVWMVANLLGSQDPQKEIDGYITSGGTEANIMGFWIARNYLRRNYGPLDDDSIAVLASPASHYSLQKACDVLGLGEGSWNECGSGWCFDPLNHQPLSHIFIPDSRGRGLWYVPSREDGSIDIGELEKMIRMLKEEKDVRRFIVFLNEWTTLTGALDDVSEADALIRRLKEEWGKYEVGFYVHVDAAYGGFIYPFLHPTRPRCLTFPTVSSVTIDPYKAARAPMAEGIFLCRKELQRYIERAAGYVNGERDDTLTGSRSGAYAAACWAIVHIYGTGGMRERLEASAQKAGYLHRALQDAFPEGPLHPIPPSLNVVAFSFDPAMPPDLLGRIHGEVIKPKHLMWSWFNPNPMDPHVHSEKIAKCCITDDVKMEWIEGLVHDLRAILH